MRALLSKYWWLVLLRGTLAIVFGILAWRWPGLTLGMLVLFFGAYALVAGLSAVIAGIAGRKESEDWWVLLLEGLVGIGIGILTFRAPGLTTVALLFFIAIWAMVSGLMQVVTAIRLRKEIKGELWMVLGGILWICLALCLVAFPLAGALTMVWVIAFVAVLSGVTQILLAFRLRHLAKA
ncbi:MAG TPA: HdeD family acid-resistance protein [Thermoanaerobaculaceae bacterium]|nr:HdeD family acid-resistance protein [Thermoanaerobaculaceae bacterium]